MQLQEKHIIECPFCQTKFHLYASLLEERRRVKCSCCKNTWFQEPIKKQKLPAEVDFIATDERSEPFERSSSIRVISNEPSKKEKLGPLPSLEKQHPILSEESTSSKKHFSLIVFFLPFLVFFLAKDYLVQIAPSLAGIYRMVGLSIKDKENSFEVRDTAWHEIIDKGISSIIVNGNLANMSPQLKSSPAIRITLKGRGGCHPMDFASYIFGDDKAEGPDGLCVMDQWSLNVSYDRLLPGQVVPFSTVHPYDERYAVEKVQIDFVE